MEGFNPKDVGGKLDTKVVTGATRPAVQEASAL